MGQETRPNRLTRLQSLRPQIPTGDAKTGSVWLNRVASKSSTMVKPPSLNGRITTEKPFYRRNTASPTKDIGSYVQLA